jgi:hypothetical protein
MSILENFTSDVQSTSNTTDAERRWYTIYVHTCLQDPRGSGDRPQDGKQYIGQTVHAIGTESDPDRVERAMFRRWNQHCRDPRSSSLLSRAIRKFGKEVFTHEVVAVVFGQTSANQVEIEYAEKFDCYEPRWYNRRKAGVQGLITFEERSEFVRRGKQAVPAELRREAARKARETLGPEGTRARIQASYRAYMALGHEARSAIAYKRSATIDWEKVGRSISAGRKALGFEKLSAASIKGKRTMGPERCSEAVRKSARTLGPEGRRLRKLKRDANMGPERRREAIRKTKATMGPERRREAARKAIVNQGPEGLKRRVQKAWDVRWLKALRAALSEKNYEAAIKVLDGCLRATLRRLAEDPSLADRIVS